jgi:hypothetical protein
VPPDHSPALSRNRILVRAHQGPFDNFSHLQTLARQNLGANVGNLLFSHSIYRLLATDAASIAFDRFNTTDPGWVNENFDVVVLPLANAFRKNYIEELDRMSSIIEQLRIPVVVAGVNAQLGLKASEPKGGIGDSVTRFVRAILRNSPNIGVRGERTVRYLRKLGFSDDELVIVGCPSMYTYGPDLPVPRLPEAITTESRISLNLSPYVQGIGDLAIAQAAKYPHLVYTAQDLPTLGLLLTGTYDTHLPVRPGFPASLDHPLVGSGRTVMPVNVPGWLEHLARFDFSFGTRIHGNIAAILAGTPAYVLAHDSRTAELAEFHAIPHRTVGKDVASLDAAALYADADYDAMLTRHKDTWAGFAGFLDMHGLRSIYSPDTRPGDFEERINAVDYPPVATLQPNRGPQVMVLRVGVIAERFARAVLGRLKRILPGFRR